MLKFNLKIELDKNKIKAKQSNAKKAAQSQLDQDVLKDSNYYIPMDTQELERSGIKHSKIGEGEIVWDTPYAKRLYYNPQFNFSKDKNPNARGLWFEAAKANRLKSWLKKVKAQYGRYFDGR